jgi:hypothetical protein
MSKWKKKGLLPWSIVGIGASGVLTGLLCLPLAAVMVQGGLALSFGPTLAAAAAGLSVLLLTIGVTRIRGRQYLTTGLAIGSGYGLVCALLCAMSGSQGAFGIWLLWLSISVLSGGLLGAIMSLSKSSHGKRRK